MYVKKIDEDLDCGIRVAFKVFGGKWKLCIIDAIYNGVTRPSEMKKYIQGATTRVIEMQLAELLHFGVVDKLVEDTYPKKTEYSLTELGLSILPLLFQIDKWGALHTDYIQQRLAQPMEKGQALK